MKKLIFKFALLALLLIPMSWIYNKFFFNNDVLKHSDEVKLSWKVTEDSCVVIYTGESSNHSHSWDDNDKRKISDFVFDYFPNMKCGDMTKDASHSEVYYHLLENISEDAPVKTVIVTMNLRSFGYDWIESDLETAIQKQLVLIKKYPSFYNRFKLAFKAYDIKDEKERSEARGYHRRNDKLVFPYDFRHDNAADWDYAKAHQGVIDSNGQWNQALTELACHYIKGYAFVIDDDNPRVKDFDRIVSLAKERGWNVIFNLMAENVDRANELVGNDLLYLMRYNRDYLINRYDKLENVTVTNNLSEVRNGLFIDQNWTTEHYCEMGRRTIAYNVAQALKEYHPEMYVAQNDFKLPKNHYRTNLEGDSAAVYSSNNNGLFIEGNTSEIESNSEKVYVSANILYIDATAESQQPTSNSQLSIVLELYKNDTIVHHDNVAVDNIENNSGKWDFITSVLPIDSTFFDAETFRIFLDNTSESAVYIKSLDVSFEYDDYARTKK